MHLATTTRMGHGSPDTTSWRDGFAARSRCDRVWCIDGQTVRVALSLTSRYPGPEAVQTKRAGMQRALKELGIVCPDAGIEFPKHTAPKVAADCVASLSHSGEWLLCAAARPASPASGMRLGVDIERRRTRRFQQIGTYLGWPSRSESDAHFYRRWTLAEALFKAGGSEAASLFHRLDQPTRTGTATVVTCERHLWHWLAWWPVPASNTVACVVVGVSAR